MYQGFSSRRMIFFGISEGCLMVLINYTVSKKAFDSNTKRQSIFFMLHYWIHDVVFLKNLMIWLTFHVIFLHVSYNYIPIRDNLICNVNSYRHQTIEIVPSHSLFNHFLIFWTILLKSFLLDNGYKCMIPWFWYIQSPKWIK